MIDSSELLDLSPAEVFRLLVEQGGPSMSRFGNCAYRGEGGRKCGIGWLIPDEIYRDNIEHHNVCAVVHYGDDVGRACLHAAMQEAHDLAANRSLLARPNDTWPALLAECWDDANLAR